MSKPFYTQHHLKTILDILSSELEPGSFEVILFGSRIDGSAREGSDLDLMIFPKSTLSWDVLGMLRDKFENSALPFAVDFSDATVADADFVARVRKNGIGLL